MLAVKALTHNSVNFSGLMLETDCLERGDDTGRYDFAADG